MLDLEDLGATAHAPGLQLPPLVWRHQASSHVPGVETADVRLPESCKVWMKTFGCSHNISDGEYIAGQLQEYGYRLLDDVQKDGADLWLINTCTVKGPSQASMSSLVARGKELGKRLVVCGCVPQGDKRLPELQSLSLLGMGAPSHSACWHWHVMCAYGHLAEVRMWCHGLIVHVRVGTCMPISRGT